MPQGGFFCNNANAALLKAVWEEHPFDEELTGLEDMHLAKKLTENGYRTKGKTNQHQNQAKITPHCVCYAPLLTDRGRRQFT